MKPKLSILIATIGQREQRLTRLLDILKPQVYKLKGAVEVVAYWNNGEFPLWQIRQKLLEEAKGEYVSFIDDDDLVPDYYCDEIIEALKAKPDYVGWRMQVWHNGEKLKPTYHSLIYPRWYDDNKGFYRNISHLNPIKRSLALKASFEVERGVAEDESWVVRVTPLVHTQVYIDKEMYWYQHTSGDSVWRGDVKKYNRYTRPPMRRRYFRWHPSSKKYHIPGQK